MKWINGGAVKCMAALGCAATRTGKSGKSAPDVLGHCGVSEAAGGRFPSP